MSRTQSVAGDVEWGELACFELTDERDLPVITHIFQAPSDRDFCVVVFAANREHIERVLIKETTMESVSTRFNRVFIADGAKVGAGPVEVRIELNAPTATVFAGLLIKLREKVKRAKEKVTKGAGQVFHSALDKVRDQCFLCKLAVKAAIEAATGGVSLAGDALDEALDELQERLADWIGGTLLEDVLDVVRSAVNPGKLVAAEVCRRLGYCP